jgi:peptidoglycan/LPS O-acetylase OafA/YrhL
MGRALQGDCPAMSERNLKFREDIQGLRALAILSVLICHCFPDFLPGGYIGVDVFFVISGYLIYSVISRGISNGNFKIYTFYVNRIKRILPALYLVLTCTLTAGLFVLAPRQFRELGRTAFSTILFVSNFDFMSLSNYFAEIGRFKPLLHTWSLSVEEQFYFVFPWFVIIIHKIPRIYGIFIYVSLVILSVLLSNFLIGDNPTVSYYLMPSRAFELLVGAISAMARPDNPVFLRLRETILGVGLLLIIIPCMIYTEATPFPGFYAVIPTIGAALMLYSGALGATFAATFFSSAPMQFFGRISYSLYLWHWPLLAYVRNMYGFNSSVVAGLLVCAASITLAALSYRFVELIKKRKLSYPSS